MKIAALSLQKARDPAVAASIPLAVVPEVFAEVHDRRDVAGGPNIAFELSRTGSFFATGGGDEAGMRRLKQLGITHTIMGGPPIPWQEADLRSLTDRHDEWTKRKFDEGKYKSSEIYGSPSDPKLKQEYEEYLKKKLDELHKQRGQQ